MTQTDTGRKPVEPIGIEQLIALNDEIAALVRCGFPLGRGLLDAGRDLPGRLGKITSALGVRMARGETLDQALEAEHRAIPPLYRAVVEAGVRAGRLPAALEGLAGYVRSYAEARRTIGLAFVYPLIVACFAYVLFFGFVTFVIPRFVEALESLQLPIALPVRWLEAIGAAAPYWWPIGPIALAGLAIGWFLSGRSSRVQGKRSSLVRLIPWSRSVLVDYEAANFADLLALLIEHGVPLPEGLTLAGEASGDPAMIRDVAEVSESLKRGEPAAAALAGTNLTIRPLLRWVLAAGQSQGMQVGALRNIASTYRKRAKYRAEKLQIFLPIALMFALGAGTTLLYGLALFVPLVNLLDGLGVP